MSFFSFFPPDQEKNEKRKDLRKMLRVVLALALAASSSAFVAPTATGSFTIPRTAHSNWLVLRQAQALPARDKGDVPAFARCLTVRMTDPTLTYFDARGVVEPTRLLLAAAGVSYEDKRYKVDMTTKPPSAPEFNADKESGALAANMGRAPILEVDGAQIGQSHAIARFLARKYSMMGSTDIEAAQIDTIYEHVRDIKEAWVKVRLNPALDEAGKKDAIDKYLTTDLPEWCKKLETSIQTFQSTSGYAVGPAMSLADVVIYAWLSCYYPAERKDEVEAAYAGCAHISKIMSTVGSHPGISEWESRRPVTAM